MNLAKVIVIVGVVFMISISILWGLKISNLSDSISKINEKKKDIKSEIELSNTDLSYIKSQIFIINNQIDDVKQSLENTNSDVKYLKNGDRYELHDPTYSEMIDFLRSDKTNQKEYIEDVYVCRHFANEVNNNSEACGIRCGYVSVFLSGPEDHAIVAFNTTDKGIVYYDPSYCSSWGTFNELTSGYYWKIDLQIGKDYYADCLTLPADFYYDPDPDCKVLDFEVIW